MVVCRYQEDIIKGDRGFRHGFPFGGEDEESFEQTEDRGKFAEQPSP